MTSLTWQCLSIFILFSKCIADPEIPWPAQQLRAPVADPIPDFEPFWDNFPPAQTKLGIRYRLPLDRAFKTAVEDYILHLQSNYETDVTLSSPDVPTPTRVPAHSDLGRDAPPRLPVYIYITPSDDRAGYLEFVTAIREQFRSHAEHSTPLRVVLISVRHRLANDPPHVRLALLGNFIQLLENGSRTEDNYLGFWP